MGTLVPESSRTDPFRGFFPQKNAAPNDLVAFRDRQISPWNTYRVRQMQRISIAINYTLGNQDLELDRATMVANSRGYTFRSRHPGRALPGKDNNKISAPVEVEIASILKRQWIPKVPASSPDPRVAAAAQVAEGVLLFNLDAGGWPETRYENAYNFVVTGTSFLTSFYDELYTELHTISAPTAVYCQQCQSPYYSKQIPMSAAQMLPQGSENLRPVAGQPDLLEMGGCPQCGGQFHPAGLDGFEPTPDMQDILGRPIMLDAPKGRARFEADIAYEMYPENGGVRVTPSSMRRICRRKVRSLDWLEERVPNAIDEYEIYPETAQTLIHQNPQLGDWGALSAYNYNYDGGLLDHHVNVDEMIEQPTVRNPMGRYVLMVRNQVLKDDDLLMKATIAGEEVWCPKMQVSIGRYRLRPGEIWGAGLPDGVISKQNRYNTIMAQHALVRGSMGSPSILASNGMNMSGPEYLTGYAGRVLRFEVDPTIPPDSKLAAPTIFPGVSFPSESYKELEILDRDIKEEVGPQEIDYGAAPKNITTTSGLQILGENSQTRRDPREVEYFNSLQRMWSHLLNIEWCKRTDEAMYEVAGPNNTWAVKKYSQLSLCGLTKVKAEKQAFAEKSIVARESIREAQVDGLIDISSPVIRKKVLESRGLPSDLNEDSSLQIDRAEQQWTDFIDEGVVPVIDQTLDNSAVRWHVFGLHLQMDEGTDLQKACRWSEFLRLIGGWEDDLASMLDAEAQQLAIYGQRFTSQQETAEPYAQQVLQYQQQKKQWDMDSKTGAALVAKGGQPPPPAGDAPMPPPKPIILPALIQDKISAIWQSKIQQNPDLAAFMQQTVPFNEKEVLVSGFVEFRAMVEAHRQLALNPPPGPTPPGSGATMVPGDKGGGPMAIPGGPPPIPGTPSAAQQVPPGGAPQTNSLPEGGRTTGRLS